MFGSHEAEDCRVEDRRADSLGISLAWYVESPSLDVIVVP